MSKKKTPDAPAALQTFLRLKAPSLQFSRDGYTVADKIQFFEALNTAQLLELEPGLGIQLRDETLSVLDGYPGRRLQRNLQVDLPFASCFVALPLSLSEGADHPVHGFLLAKGGFWGVTEAPDEGFMIVLPPLFSKETNQVVEGGSAWAVLLGLLLDRLNSSDLLVPRVTRGPVTFRDGKTLRRKIPPPYYYKIKISQEIKEAPPVGPPSEPVDVEWSHRWDVRGHSRLMVQRGDLPLAAKKQASLIKRGYAITVGPMGGKLGETMRFKGKTCQPGQWIGAQLVPVKSCVKGPEDKPYIPATRVIG